MPGVCQEQEASLMGAQEGKESLKAERKQEPDQLLLTQNLRFQHQEETV